MKKMGNRDERQNVSLTSNWWWRAWRERRALAVSLNYNEIFKLAEGGRNEGAKRARALMGKFPGLKRKQN